jgi:hypothetical protein
MPIFHYFQKYANMFFFYIAFESLYHSYRMNHTLLHMHFSFPSPVHTFHTELMQVILCLNKIPLCGKTKMQKLLSQFKQIWKYLSKTKYSSGLLLFSRYFFSPKKKYLFSLMWIFQKFRNFLKIVRAAFDWFKFNLSQTLDALYDVILM